MLLPTLHKVAVNFMSQKHGETKQKAVTPLVLADTVTHMLLRT